MNENENLQPVEKLTPFTKMVMSIGTLPSSFYASMSYYESMVWLYEYLKNQVIPTVNNNAEAVEELQAKYLEFSSGITEEVTDFKSYINGKVDELETYMNNYFTNLDVQQEINNKLDAMATDGTLTDLIKNYVDPIINEYENEINNTITIQNSQISSQSNQISALSSRMDTFTNLPQGSTSGDAELADIRTGYDGVNYTNAGSAVRDQVSDLHDQINIMKRETLRYNAFDGAYINGLYKFADGTFDNTRTDYVSTKNKIYTNNAKCLKLSDITSSIIALYIMYYQSNDTFISSVSYDLSAMPIKYIPDNTGYIRISLSKGTGTPITASELTPLSIYFDDMENSTFDVVKSSLNLQGLGILDFQHTVYHHASGSLSTFTNIIGTYKTVQVKQNTTLYINNGYKIRVCKFNSMSESPTSSIEKTTEYIDWTTGPLTIEKDEIITLCLSKTDDSSINTSECINLSIIPENLNNNIIQLINQSKIENLRYNHFDGIYKNGLYKSADGTFDSSRSDYISSKNKIYVTNSKYLKLGNIPANISTIYIMYYQSDDTFISSTLYNQSNGYDIIPNSTSYIRLSLTKGSHLESALDEIPPVTVYVDDIQNSTYDVINMTLNANRIDVIDLQNFIYYHDQGLNGPIANRIGIIHPIKLKQDTSFKVNTGFAISFCKFNTLANLAAKANEIIDDFINWKTTEIICKKGEIITFNIKKTDESNLSASDALNNLFITPIPETTIGENYSIDSAMNKKKVTLERLGTVAGLQSFVKYNNKFYVYDSLGKMYIYDNTLTLKDTVDINLGHGNAMQLGDDGIVYVSGWDDSTVYVVDLDTVTITSTISIPNSLTGYNTCCVDEINKILYIFNGSSESSSSEVNYNFVKYDYLNQHIISTRKLSKFGAMQGCDYLDGKIIALNGLGGLYDVPNYYKIYNTNGDVISEYILDGYSTGEPEGVFIDRTTKDVYIQLNYAIYKIIQ